MKKAQLCAYLLVWNLDNILKIINIKRFIITIVDPVGVPLLYEINNPNANVTKDKIELDIITFLKLLNICIEQILGKIIKLDINKAPISLMPSTIIIEQRLANIILYKSVLIPIDLANVSSNVKANILLYDTKYKTITRIERIIETITSVLLIDNMLPNK